MSLKLFQNKKLKKKSPGNVNLPRNGETLEHHVPSVLCQEFVEGQVRA